MTLRLRGAQGTSLSVLSALSTQTAQWASMPNVFKTAGSGLGKVHKVIGLRNGGAVSPISTICKANNQNKELIKRW
jgi:hypothetical protein